LLYRYIAKAVILIRQLAEKNPARFQGILRPSVDGLRMTRIKPSRMATSNLAV